MLDSDELVLAVVATPQANGARDRDFEPEWSFAGGGLLY